ncbi:hypothetical protein EVAR_63705_1 [Eumeta japonica]|uniref:Uncharacterized protein n=1 Tax=Eumeta variegata TaxID=151549 RepID=A0A4C1ZU78_EUMVA|nr:hypothetical protein EVAR_63705_1 [Eumeta japonica]
MVSELFRFPKIPTSPAHRLAFYRRAVRARFLPRPTNFGAIDRQRYCRSTVTRPARREFVLVQKASYALSPLSGLQAFRGDGDIQCVVARILACPLKIK